jgi:hypothetical protein
LIEKYKEKKVWGFYSNVLVFSCLQIVIPFLCMAASTITTIESLKFDLATIEAATHKFSDDNKLGGGGFGEVYQVWN